MPSCGWIRYRRMELVVTKRRPLFACISFASLVCLALGGCAGLDDCRYESTQKLRAIAAYRDCGAPGCERYPHDYKLGFLDGFYTISTGGPDCPPLVAPSRYWKPGQVIGDCDNRRHSYYHGWQDGASRASCYPDTHHLRLFETCECPAPRCQPCATGCVPCGTAAVPAAIGPGMIHAEWMSDPAAMVTDAAAYPTPIAAPIVASETEDRDESDSDEASEEAEDKSDDDGDDDDDRRSRKPRSQDRKRRPTEDAEEMPAPKPAARRESEDVEATKESLEDDVPSPSDVLPQLEPQSLGRPSPDDATSNQDVAPEVRGRANSPLMAALDAVNPAMIDSNRDQSIDGPIELATGELQPSATPIATTDATPLDRRTIQSMFGISRDFDFGTSGPVQHQTFDPALGDSASPSVADTPVHPVVPVGVTEATFDPAAATSAPSPSKDDAAGTHDVQTEASPGDSSRTTADPETTSA